MNPSPKFCGKCGVSLEPGACFCGECGTTIKEFQECDQKSTSKNHRPDSPPRTSPSQNDTDSHPGQPSKKVMTWIQDVPLWGRIFLLLVLIFLLSFGIGISILVKLFVLIVIFLLVKGIVSILGKKR
jgi:uncharacterized membrane protein YvbJ